MKPTYIAIVLVGIGLALGIVYLVRRDHIYIRQALFWLAVAGVSFVLAVFPLIDAVGGFFGIAYPPTLVLLAAIVVLVVKALLSDIAHTQQSRDLRRLNQRIAMLEAESAAPRPPKDDAP
ncbi:MAG: DUF2304 domain-containing protein [Betaproteobacteria bacterium]|nr:DUF2304 domain-containing protein [Betaproteobacteria bacterium]